jgi:hypothetical protein
MGDILFYISAVLVILGIPALIILTIFFMIKPHVINNRRENPLSRKHILAIGLVSIFIAFIGFGSVMAATEPASVKASIAAQQAADEKAAQELKLKQQQEAIDAAKPIIKSVTSTEPIVFESTNQNDNSLPSGRTEISVKGVNGVRTIAYDVTYVNGKEISRKQTSSKITTAPVNQVTLIGTYVAPVETPTPTTTSTTDSNCTNGTYVNSAGNTVCSPEISPTVPAGATAQCRDGTYSFSQSRSGTCSHHGGVASWL